MKFLFCAVVNTFLLLALIGTVLSTCPAHCEYPRNQVQCKQCLEEVKEHTTDGWADWKSGDGCYIRLSKHDSECDEGGAKLFAECYGYDQAYKPFFTRRCWAYFKTGSGKTKAEILGELEAAKLLAQQRKQGFEQDERKMIKQSLDK